MRNLGDGILNAVRIAIEATLFVLAVVGICLPDARFPHMSLTIWLLLAVVMVAAVRDLWKVRSALRLPPTQYVAAVGARLRASVLESAAMVMAAIALIILRV